MRLSLEDDVRSPAVGSSLLDHRRERLALRLVEDRQDRGEHVDGPDERLQTIDGVGKTYGTPHEPG